MRFAALLGACAVTQAASTWKDLFAPPFTGVPIQIMLGISCPAVDMCFIAGGNSAGYGVYQVSDPTFKSGVKQLAVNGKSPMKLLMTTAMEDTTHGVVGGLGLLIGGTYYTVDGQTFESSTFEYGLVTTQAAYSLGGGHFAYVGSYNGHQGAAISTNGGVSYKGAWWPKNFSADAPARYGAFPSDSVMYVTGGTWPQDNQSDTRDMSSRVRFNTNTGKHEVRMGATNQGTTGEFTAAITKSSDGGATWKVQYHSTGKFYFNGIHCASPTVCMAVAEGDTGAHVFKTEDGETWKEVLVWGNTTGGSAVDVKMLSETEAWVGFSFAVSTLNSGAVMAHTTDGGKTWDYSKTMGGVGAVMALSFVDSNNAFAAAVTVFQISTVLRFAP